MIDLDESLLTGTLRDRLARFDAGGWPMAAWREQADGWNRTADEVYRTCSHLRPVPDAELPVTVGVKDTIDVAGMPTTYGLRSYSHVARRSATILERLARTAVCAKVVTTELNLGLGSGCGNPYFPDYDPAGSSTGSAVAVAAGICDLGLGTDVLGSVRWPAGRCGVVGLRTTHDPRRMGGILPLSPSMDAIGWVTRTADDLAVLWGRLALGRPVVSAVRRIGVVDEALTCPAPEVVGALGRVVAALAEAGHSARSISVGEAWQWRAAAWELCARDGADQYRGWTDAHWEKLGESTRRALAAGERVHPDRAAEIRTAQARLRAAVGGVFMGDGVDAWLLPLDPTVPRRRDQPRTSAATIPAPGDPDYENEIGFTPLASFLGLPAIAFPIGTSRSGAPLAAQLVGPPGSEPVLISLAADIANSLPRL